MVRPKTERRAAGALLLLQDGAERELRGAFRSRAPEDKKKPRRANWLVPTLSGVIYAQRQAARTSARRRLSAELTDLGVPLEGYHWVISNRRLIDQRAADTVAHSLGLQWRTVEAKAIEEEEKPGPRMMRARLARAARTEVARAYSEEHREAIRDVVDYDRRFRDGQLATEIESALRRRWSAMADACERCSPCDGEEVGINESFSCGEPGGMHPHCACIEYLVRV
jgi:hypothetical protein